MEGEPFTTAVAAATLPHLCRRKMTLSSSRNAIGVSHWSRNYSDLCFFLVHCCCCCGSVVELWLRLPLLQASRKRILSHTRVAIERCLTGYDGYYRVHTVSYVVDLPQVPDFLSCRIRHSQTFSCLEVGRTTIMTEALDCGAGWMP
ncbi:uncharacterized protein LOC107484654 [Arachis duranensis]|uniref:Uncharacterized protein LOC107484654 n=1 Tax=Arachis duranensis TaxID=130453 RepID=A0A6P4D1X1_ARADU|nr:uncharacterized protein LOC107484654 [Arachis duranensis]XP_020996190.1 uncharacterized protein LOC107484654 [Arachis duranensis]